MIYEEIQKQFNEVLRFSQNLGSLSINTDKLFQDWAKAKEYFIKKFHGLIYEVPGITTFTLTPEEKEARVDAFADKILDEYRNRDLALFILENKEGFFDNKVIKESSLKSIPIGMKIIKAFKFFEDDSEILKDIQNEASMIIQENKVKGKLCFSVHPLDFLSLSENNHKWRSCHALDGDYRSGNLSLMMDKCTFIAYLKSEEDEHLKMFPSGLNWNSKKWRTLFFLSDNKDLLFAARQYPFSIHNQMDMIKDYISDVLNIEFSCWNDKTIDSYKVGDEIVGLDYEYIGIGGSLKSLYDIVKDRSSLHYNDLLYSTVSKPMWAYKIIPSFFSDVKKPWTANSTQIEVGGKVMCIHCGDHPIISSDTMFCKDCEIDYGSCQSDEFVSCTCCGEVFYDEDGAWDIHDNPYCPDCVETELRVCERCGEYAPIYEGTTNDEDEFICNRCLEEE